MIVPVADQILKQFAANFARRVQEIAEQAPAASGAETGAAPGTPGAAAPETSLNALGLLWGMIKDGLRRLFGKKPG